MKMKFFSKRSLLAAALVLSLTVSSSSIVPAAENIAGNVTEAESSDAENSGIEIADMETPIIPVADADSTDDAAVESSSEETTEDFTEIDITDVTPDEVIFEDDITYINPCYSDTMSEDDLVEASDTEALDPSSASTVFGTENINGITFYTTQDDAAAEIRSEMTEHAATISIGYEYNGSDYSTEMQTVFKLALNHTGICDEGDYLKWTYGGYKGSISGYTSNGIHYLLYKYTMTYYTTAEQETAFASEVDNVFNQLGISELESDYAKIEAIYQYICSHVTYDYTHLDDSTYKLQYTAYAALINGTSVCQGYANLFYYMALKAGVDARFIAGLGHGGAHGWNIVQLNGLYYNMDTTWDADCGSNVEKYDYFLKSDADFTGHTRYDEYSTDSFYASYPMAAESYQEQAEEPLTVTVYGHSLVLDGTIGVNFYLDFSDAEKVAAGSYVTLQNSVSGAEEKIDLEDAALEDGHFRFTYQVAAKEMADPIALTFYDGTTEEELCTDTYSASDYAGEQIEAGDSISDLVTAMLNYGTCAQDYFDYQTDTPANAAISTSGSDNIPEVDADTLKAYARVKSGSLPEGIHTYGQSLVLNDGVSVKYYYQLDEGARISDYTATLVSGSTSTSLAWQSAGADGCYYVEIDDVDAADLDRMYEVDVTDGTSTGSVQYGAMTYVYNTLSASEGCSDSLKNLCRALYYYSQAAEEYFAA